MNCTGSYYTCTCDKCVTKRIDTGSNQMMRELLSQIEDDKKAIKAAYEEGCRTGNGYRGDEMDGNDIFIEWNESDAKKELSE